jgi:hypothetical protein
MHPLIFPVPHHVAHDGGDIVDAAAADANGDTGTGFQPAGEGAAGKLLLDLGGNIGDTAIRKVLAYDQETGELHDTTILAVTARL